MNAGEFARLDQRADDCPVLTGAIRSSEESCGSAQSDGLSARRRYCRLTTLSMGGRCACERGLADDEQRADGSAPAALCSTSSEREQDSVWRGGRSDAAAAL
jgi:hypothetical protein